LWLTVEDIEALTRVAGEAGMDITGPPISDTELAEYLAALPEIEAKAKPFRISGP
jgi:hypothetical protein